MTFIKNLGKFKILLCIESLVYKSYNNIINIAYCKVTWIGLDWIGLDWIGLDWIGLDWIISIGDFQILFQTKFVQKPTTETKAWLLS